MSASNAPCLHPRANWLGGNVTATAHIYECVDCGLQFEFTPQQPPTTPAAFSAWRTAAGPAVLVELVLDGDTIQYHLTGQGLSEQIGSSRLPKSDLLAVLLTPLGMRATPDGRIL